MIDVKFSMQRFKDHFYYSKWLYVAFVLVGVFVFSMVFSVTKPVVPNEYKVDISILATSLQDSEMSVWSEEILALLSQDQQEVNIYAMGFDDSEDSTMGYSIYEILAARMAAREGDIYIMSKNMYISLAQQGAFFPLDDIALNYEYAEDLDLEEYKIQIEDTDKPNGQAAHYYGLPLDNVLGLVDLGVDPREKVICVMIYTENYDNAIKAVDYIMNKSESVVITSYQEMDGQ